MELNILINKDSEVFMIENYCRVCGLYSEDLPWGADGNTPSYLICHCCGVEFGYEDSTIESIKKYRMVWLGKGSIWFRSKYKPENWDLNLQLKNIKSNYL